MFWFNAVGGSMLSCVVLNNALAAVANSRRKRRKERDRKNPVRRRGSR